jgi:SHS family lactate transporter-like MFS transporter
MQRSAFLAAFLGWTLDAFDYFLLVFVLDEVAKTFQTDHNAVAFALTLTLAFRPLGAFLFGIAADRYGRRIPLMVDVILFSVLELLSGFAPNLTIFLVLRALFGVAMGGEWGLGAALALETAPAGVRGLLSGILQEGYSVGYLLAALIYPLVVPHLGWRWMFFVGALPALLSLYIRTTVKESPVWEAARAQSLTTSIPSANRPKLTHHLGLFVYLVLLMTSFTFMSHGTQDLYPTFLKTQRHFTPGTVSAIAVTYNIGALFGGIFFGWLSQRIGRRRAIVLAALLALPVIPLWAYGGSPLLLALGAFLMQFFVQGAWGVIPAHLTELSPNALRGTFTGFAYQLGNLLSSTNANIQTELATRRGNNYAWALSRTIGVVLIAVAVTASLGREAKDAEFTD